MIQRKYIPSYIYFCPLLVKVNFLKFVDFDYIANTIILYFIVHCINVLCLFYAWHACVNLLCDLCVAWDVLLSIKFVPNSRPKTWEFGI